MQVIWVKKAKTRPFLHGSRVKKSTPALLHRSAHVKYISSAKTIQGPLVSMLSPRCLDLSCLFSL